MYVLEHRYIRRGTAEPWTPFQSANTFGQALEYIDDNAVALSAALRDIQVKRAQYQEKKRLEDEEKKHREQQELEFERHKTASEEAFCRLLASPKGSAIAQRYNAFVENSKINQDFTSRARTDAEFMRRYNAVMEAEKVPAKQKAIREFLAYAEKF